MVFMVVKSDLISRSDIVQRLSFRGMAIPGFHNEVRALKLRVARRPKTQLRVKKQVVSCVSCHGPADSRADSAIRIRGNLSRHVVEQLVAESRRLVESAWGVHLRDHRELTGPDEDLDSDRVVFERPAQPKALVRLREPVPPQPADPRAAQRADEPPQVDMSRERGLENRRVRPGGLQRARTQEAEGAPRDAIPEVCPLHELAVGESMERAGELLRMDAQASPQSLKGDLRIRIMGQELEDLAVVVAQVVESLSRRRVHGGRYHVERTHGGGLP